ncbi:MAG TPA: VOC family protein [Ktedonobacteraceae bacterium]|nr:VOC family protein [Ktedonobacteraceae bacterium]
MPQSWPLKRVGLRVRDLATSIAYYQLLGLHIVRNEPAEGIVGLGASEQELLTLRHVPAARPRPRHTAGLYHFALLLPGEAELGTFLRHCLEDGVNIDGASDHLVSQALYLSDPEANGIEVYADRPREQWSWNNGRPAMDTLPLKANELLAKAGSKQGFPEGTILGHMHLNVSDLEQNLTFYQQTFGLELMVNLYQQAGFVFCKHLHQNATLTPHDALVAVADMKTIVLLWEGGHHWY